MNIIKCRNGHYYDSDKFGVCPHCRIPDNNSSSNMSNQNVTYSERDISSVSPPIISDASGVNDISEQKTIRLKQTDSNDIVTESMPQQSPLPPTQPLSQLSSQPASQPNNRPQMPVTTVEDLIKKAASNRKPQDNNVTVRFTGNSEIPEPTVGWLIGINDDYYGECFELKTGKNFIGRSNDMDIVLSMDNSVSRNRHAIVIYEPHGRIFIAQPGESRELFYINNNVVLKNEVLNPYDIIVVGNTKLMFFPLCGQDFSWDDIENN